MGCVSIPRPLGVGVGRGYVSLCLLPAWHCGVCRRSSPADMERERTGLGSEIIGKKSLTYRPPTPGGCRKPTTNLCALQPCVSEHMGVGVVSRANLPGAHSAACPWQAVSCQNSSSTFGRPISRGLFGPAFQFVGGFRGMMRSAQQPPDQWQKMDSGALCLSLSLCHSQVVRVLVIELDDEHFLRPYWPGPY